MSAYIIVDIEVRDAQSYDRYGEARAMRRRAARTNMVVIEGVP